LIYFFVSIDSPGAADLAEELGQKLLGKQIVKSGFVLNTYESHAVLEFPDSSKELIEKIETEASNWISWKHPGLKKRRILGKRQTQNLGLPTDAAEDLVCLEIRK